MHYVVRRFGFRITRGWFALIVIASALTAAAFWVGPFRPLPARLQLLARHENGSLRDTIVIPSAWADTLPAASEATARFPLVLAVRNIGSMTVQPSHVALSIPSRYRLTNARREPLPFRTTMGSPLVRYNLPIRIPPVAPRQPPMGLPGLDTLWLEPIVPTIYCTAGTDSVPDFVAAPQQDPVALSRIAVFYSFAGERIRQRQTGVMHVQVDPNLVKRTPSPNPPIFETEIRYPEAPRPQLDSLKYIGQRTTWCGDPGQPMAIGDVLFETREGGRYFVVYYGSKPRKWLFDLNRDSIIELEMWDSDQDGKFESRRTARMMIPAFLMPYTAADTAMADSAALALMDTTATTPEWMRMFYDTAAGVLRYTNGEKAGGREGEKAGGREGEKAGAPPTPTQSLPPLKVPENVRVDTAWLQLFNNTGAGVLRFRDAAAGKPIKPAPPPRRAAPVQRETGPKLLGVPVDSVRH